VEPDKVSEKAFKISEHPEKPAFWRVFSFWRSVGPRWVPAISRVEPLSRLPELRERIDTYKGRALTRLTVLLSLHVFVRSSELRF